MATKHFLNSILLLLLSVFLFTGCSEYSLRGLSDLKTHFPSLEQRKDNEVIVEEKTKDFLFTYKQKKFHLESFNDEDKKLAKESRLNFLNIPQIKDKQLFILAENSKDSDISIELHVVDKESSTIRIKESHSYDEDSCIGYYYKQKTVLVIKDLVNKKVLDINDFLVVKYKKRCSSFVDEQVLLNLKNEATTEISKKVIDYLVPSAFKTKIKIKSPNTVITYSDIEIFEMAKKFINQSKYEDALSYIEPLAYKYENYEFYFNTALLYEKLEDFNKAVYFYSLASNSLIKTEEYVDDAQKALLRISRKVN